MEISHCFSNSTLSRRLFTTTLLSSFSPPPGQLPPPALSADEYNYLDSPRGCCSEMLSLKAQSQARGGQGPPQPCPLYCSLVHWLPCVTGCFVFFMAMHVCCFYVTQTFFKSLCPGKVIQPKEGQEFSHLLPHRCSLRPLC